MRWTRPPSWSIRIGASRPTVSRSAAVSAVSCAGVSMLRLKTMKPHGAAARKNASSSAVSTGPEQPAMKARAVIAAENVGSRMARGCWRRSVLGDEAGPAGRLELGAELGGVVARHRPDPHAIDGLAVDLGGADQGRASGERTCIFALEGLVLLAGFYCDVHHRELHREAADGVRGLGRRRPRH